MSWLFCMEVERIVKPIFVGCMGFLVAILAVSILYLFVSFPPPKPIPCICGGVHLVHIETIASNCTCNVIANV